MAIKVLVVDDHEIMRESVRLREATVVIGKTNAIATNDPRISGCVAHSTATGRDTRSLRVSFF